MTPPASHRIERPATRRGVGVQARISLALAATAVTFTSILLMMQSQQHRQLEALLRERSAESQRVLERILDLRASAASMHADDYTRWDDFVTFVRTHDPEWAYVNVTENIATFGLDVAWVLDDRFRHIFTANPEDTPAFATPPMEMDALARRLARSPVNHFFVSTSDGLLEVWTSSIHPSDDNNRAVPPRGYYIIGRRWTPEFVADLAAIADGAVRIAPAAGFEPGTQGSIETGRIEVRKPLDDIAGRAVAGLVFSTAFPVGQQVSAALRASSMLAMLGALLSLVVVWWAVEHWIGRPLAVITHAMQREDATPLEPVRRRRDELGEVADLVSDFFIQRGKLIEARRAAEAAALAKSNFLANISHELRTPMHGILSFSRFGLRDAEASTRDELRGHFRQINECGESLLALLNSLLDLAKLEAGRMTFSFSDVSLQDVADLALDEFRSFYHECKIELAAELAPDLSPVVADRMRMPQVVRNLVSNAAKFTPIGGVVLVRLAADGDRQRVVVEDSGVGIPAGEEELIFHKFTQASHTSPRTGGTGLGLAICREIVEAHEGRIWAENREGGGARVTFEVPVKGPAAARELEPQRKPTEGTDAPSTDALLPSKTVNDRWRRAA